MAGTMPTLGRLEGSDGQGESLLCLSGDGYRAALFHLGALTRLNELGLLARIDTVGAVGGGCILGAVLAGGVPWPLRGPFPEWAERVGEPLREIARRGAPRAFRRRAGAERGASGEEQYARRLARSLGEAEATRPRFVFGASGLTLAGLAGRGDGAGVDWALEESVPAGYGEELVGAALGALPAGLAGLGEAERAVLENHGYLLADAALRATASAPREPRAAPPHPDWMDEKRVRESLAGSGWGGRLRRFR